MRKWRRPDDEFVYELVVVSSGDEALIAARFNVNLQAVVIRRRFSHQSTRDLSTLSEFVDTAVSHELADHQSPDERAQILAISLAKLRPELDLYLMTEIEVEDIAGRLGQYFRRVFHAREGMLELHLSILQGVAARYRTPFFSALKEYSHRPTGVFHALPISQGKSIVNSHWIRDMVGFYGLDVFMAETSATCGGLDSLLEPTGPLREAQQLAAQTYGSRHTYFVTNGTSTANKIVTQALVAPGDIVLLDRNCHQSHHYGMMLAGANVVYLEAYPLNEYSMYGAVPLREIKSKLLALRARRQARPGQDDVADELHRSTASSMTSSVSWRSASLSSPIWCSCGTRHGSRSHVFTRSIGLAPRWRRRGRCESGCRTLNTSASYEEYLAAQDDRGSRYTSATTTFWTVASFPTRQEPGCGCMPPNRRTRR